MRVRRLARRSRESCPGHPGFWWLPGALLLLALSGSLSEGVPREGVPREGVPLEEQRISIDRDDIVIDRDTVILPGRYAVLDANGDGVLHIAADDITLRFENATLVGQLGTDPADPDDLTGLAGLDPDRLTGRGIVSKGHSGVTLRGAHLEGFDIGISLSDGGSLVIMDCDVSRGYRPRLRSDLLREPPPSLSIEHPEEPRGVGIAIRDCHGVILERSRFRSLQHGIRLERVRQAQLAENDGSFLSGWGLSLEETEGCRVFHNRFDVCARRSPASSWRTWSGAGGIVLGRGSSRNVFARNRATHGERGVVVRGGRGAFSNVGNVLYENNFSSSTIGIDLEGALETQVLGNQLENCELGVRLVRSPGSRLVANLLAGAETTGLLAEASPGLRVLGNVVRGGPQGIEIRHVPAGDGPRVSHNRFASVELALRLENVPGAVLEANRFESCDEELKAIECPDLERLPGDENAVTPRLPPPPPGLADRPPPPIPEGFSQGRRDIFITGWGPDASTEPRLWPPHSAGAGQARFYLLGPRLPFRVTRVSSQVEVSPKQGAAPMEIRVFAPRQVGVVEFEFDVTVDDQIHTARGTLLPLPWQISYFSSSQVPTPKAEPVAEVESRELDFEWGTDLPHPDLEMENGFSLRARATVELPAGTYRLAMRSSGPLSVVVDGERRVETAGPSADTRTLELTKGSHEVQVRYQHRSGQALLRVILLPAP